MKSIHVDPFAADNLANLEIFQGALHSAGPVAWLPQYKVYVTGRFQVAKTILNNSECFQSKEGVGLLDNRVTTVSPIRVDDYALVSSVGGIKRTPLVEIDGVEHSVNRKIVEASLDALTIKSIIGESRNFTERLIGPLVARREFDVVTELVIPVVLHAFPNAYGVEEKGRENLIALAELALNSLGPRNDTFKKSATQLPLLEKWMQGALPIDALDEQKIARRIFVNAMAAGLDIEGARRLIRAVLISAIDTTVAGVCNTIFRLARRPDIWRKIRRNPELAVKAFEESTRLDAPVQMCYRLVAFDCELEGLTLRGGTRIMVHLGAACCDPSYFSDPQQFDMARRSQHSLTFGAGIHRCLGHALARGQATGIIQAMARDIEHLRCVKPVSFIENNTLRRPEDLLVNVSPARGWD